MGKYSCEKCAKTFSQKSHYDKHLSRKNPCEIGKPCGFKSSRV